MAGLFNTDFAGARAAANAGSSDFSNKINALWQSSLGRQATSQEIAGWASKAGADPDTYIQNTITPWLTSTDEYKQARSAAATTSTQNASDLASSNAYKAYAPIANNEYGQLYNLLQNQYKGGEENIKYNLGQRGILDSGSYGADLASMTQAQGQEAVNLGGAIENQRNKFALDAGTSATQFGREQQLQQNNQDWAMTQENANRQWQADQANAQNNPWGKVLDFGAQAAIAYISTL